MQAQAQLMNITLTHAIQIAQQQSYDAMVARLSFMSQYWSYRSFQAEMLPAVNLSDNLNLVDGTKVKYSEFEYSKGACYV